MVEGFIRLTAAPQNFTGPANLGNPGEFSMLELACQVIEMTGSWSTLALHSLPEDDSKQRRPDITLAKSKLDWQPKVPLREGLQPTINYFDRLLADRTKEDPRHQANQMVA